MDPVRMIESQFSKLFFVLFHNEGARKYLGFSQISALSNEEDMPFWYLWLAGKNGCFQLELIEGNILQPKEQQLETFISKDSIIKGRLAIRYYPSGNEDDFENYSYFEKLIRLGSLFDSTGAPTFEGRRRIHESYFVVGYIDIRVNTSQSFLELECFAPEKWEDFRVNGLYLKTPDQDDYEAVARGGRDRNVPGWMLTSFLFDKILSGFCYTFKVAPCSVVLSSEEGFSFYIDENNRVDKRMNPDLKQSRLVCGLDLEKKGHSPFKEDKNLDLYIQSVKDRLNREEGDIKGIWKRPEDITNLHINPNWWKAKNMEFQEEDSEISCYHDH